MEVDQTQPPSQPKHTKDSFTLPAMKLSTNAQNLFKLFHLVFSSLTKYPKNEAALHPHLQNLITECLKRSMEGNDLSNLKKEGKMDEGCKEEMEGGFMVGSIVESLERHMIWPGPYMNLLRMLFRTISGGKFEDSYKELLPLIPTTLNGLYRIYIATDDAPLRLIIMELCLTVPARLSVLLPHLPLLVKIIIPALQSNQGDLVNLGLRTLEFWVDNLSPDYLFPILAQQSSTLCELMVSLTQHLQPAPYPYGLLCLRLLGKLGGKNRIFLQELMGENLQQNKTLHKSTLSIYCEWPDAGNSQPGGWVQPLPLSRAVEVLQYVAAAPKPISIISGEKFSEESGFKSVHGLEVCPRKHLAKLLSQDAENIEFNLYSLEIMEVVKRDQSKSAFQILRSALAAIVHVSEDDDDSKTPLSVASDPNSSTDKESLEFSTASSDSKTYTDSFRLICDGLFAATAHKDLREEAFVLLKGLGAHIFYAIANHLNNITRIDCDGGIFDPMHHIGLAGVDFDSQNHLADGKVQPLKPFGCFRIEGALAEGVDPFAFNKSLVDAFAGEGVKDSQVAAGEVLSFVVDLHQQVKSSLLQVKNSSGNRIHESWGDILFENLLSAFTLACFSKQWSHRCGVMNGMYKLMTKMGLSWCKQFEVEIMHTVLFLVKDAPNEISLAKKQSIRFFCTVITFFYTVPSTWKDSNSLIKDALCPDPPHHSPPVVKEAPVSVRTASLTLILSELTSTKHMVRFAVRHALRVISRDNASLSFLLSSHTSSLRHKLFPRLLRLLSLPDQVALVDAVAFIIDKAPTLFPISDPNLLSFCAELLKMISVADGEIPDENFTSVVLIDKNGFVSSDKSRSNSHSENKKPRHASSTFLNSSFTLADKHNGFRVLVPSELSLGVQLRVSTLLLFRALIRAHPNDFFDAKPQTQIGNIRPHVVALFFRSLISDPAEAVSASSSALRDALLLGSTKLPKELIQTCIRPILLRLRDHEKLTVPLLMGLSKLLSLLSTWFNKTLGEKLLEHLQKFTEPEKIIAVQLLKPGEEPLVAAALIDLFSCLPSASQFTEALVKSTIRLESVLPKYKPVKISPFRKPLARYLSRHPGSAAGFFLEEHRLSNPMYSDLFLDILKLDEAAPLRKYFSGKECTVMLINVCFERPLAIIRSQKSSKLGTESLALHGINQWFSPSIQRKLEGARQDLEAKQKLLNIKKQDEVKAQKVLQQSKSDETNSAPGNPEKQNEEQARQAVARAQKELDSALAAYQGEISQASFQSSIEDPRPMTLSALELQHQGFRIVEVLMSFDQTYLHEHSDVVRAFRWLWRSRGRHYRHLHEEEMPPRFHFESMNLAKFLVLFSQSNVTDVDVLFDLIRIFLQPSSMDFSFLSEFLQETVSECLTVEQKGQVLQRFLAMLSSEGTEETKILSIQLLVHPMLAKSFEDSSLAPNKIVTDASVRQLLKSLKDGFHFGPKLTCELLRLINVLLEHNWENMIEHRKDLIKYIWAHIKDESSTKYYGYLAVSRFVSVFETPPKMTLQVYVSLLRSHHPAEKRIVRSALDLLVPSLPIRFSPGELEKAMDYTAKIMYEEGNSITQLAHLWEVITRHPQVFSDRKTEFLPHMVTSLSKLGTPPNSPSASEHRELSVCIAKLILDWGTSCTPRAGAKQSITDSVANFLIRTALANAESKPDPMHHKISIQVMSLLKEIASSEQTIVINPVYFEKVFNEENHTSSTAETSIQLFGPAKGTARSSKSSSSKELSAPPTPPNLENGALDCVLCVCLDFFLLLQLHCPGNDFLQNNICKILPLCFQHAPSSKDANFKETLQVLLVHIVTDGFADGDVLSNITAFLDKTIMSSVGKSRHENNVVDVPQDVILAIEIVKKICETKQEYVESFLNSLFLFAKEVANTHIEETASKSRHVSSMQQMAGSGHRLSATPTLGVFELACGIDFNAASSSKELPTGQTAFKNQLVKDTENVTPSVRSLISCVRLIGSSSLAFKLSPRRHTYLEILAVLLESSNTLSVLMTVVWVIKKWVVVDGQQGPLTKSERNSFLSRLSSIDFQKLPETASQALAESICHLCLSMIGHDFDNTSLSSSSHQATHCRQKSKFLVEDSMFCKLLMSGLLSSANPFLRNALFQNFATELSRPTKDNSTNGCGNTLHAVLHRLFSSDFEGLGCRLWTAVIADLLLACSDCGELTIARKKSMHQIFMSKADADNIETSNGFLRLKYEKSDAVFVVDVCSHYGQDVYSSFKNTLLKGRKVGRRSCLDSMRALIHGHVELCQSSLELCFNAAWGKLSSSERSSLIKPLESLLAKPCYSQFLKTSQSDSINSIQSVLRLLVVLRPMPVIDIFLIESLSSDFKAQFEVLTYLENLFVVLKRNGYERFNSPPFDLIMALKRVFDSVDDTDNSFSIVSAVSSDFTRFATSLDRYGYVNKCCDAYLSLIDRADDEHAEYLPSELELSVWEERWVEAHKEMSQWPLIDEFATSAANPNLMMECAWKMKNWEKVKSLCTTPSVIASLEEGDPLTKMSEIYLSIHEGKLSEVENLHAQTAQLCLHRWQLLPGVGPGSNAHKSLLQQFQRLVELRESSQIMIETSSHSAGRTVPDLKNLLSSWRSRVPNTFEPLPVWEDLFLWRFQIFDAITTNFSWCDPGTLATLHDRPFSSICFARVARKQSLKEVSMQSLNTLVDCAMDVQDAFLKLREQILAYQHSSDINLLKGGLNLVNSTNLSFFDARQKAELFRLKAHFLNALHDKPKSNQAYCHAVQVCPTYARTWIDWGNLCVSLCDKNQDSMKKTKYYAQAMGCFLEALRCDTNHLSREHIPLCLSMLSHDGSSPGLICQTFETKGPLIQSWVWLPWIPQLLTSLCRVEAKACKTIIGGLIQDYPQAIYYSLRAFFLERRDIERSRGDDPNQDERNLSSVKYSEILMSNLRKSHPALWIKLEAILEDLIIRFRPSYEAELLATVVALLQKATSRQDTNPNDNKTEERNLLESYLKTLTKIGIKFFNKEKPDGSKARKAVLFHSKYAAPFEKDFLEKKSGPAGGLSEPESIDELVEKLKKWKDILEKHVSRVPGKCKLQEASPSLAWFCSESPDLWAGACESKSLAMSNSQNDSLSSYDNILYQGTPPSALAAAKASSHAVLAAANTEGLGGHSGGGSAGVEIPGQYAPTSSNILDSRPYPELHSKLIRFEPTLEVISSSTKQDHLVRRICMVGSDGNTYNFLLQLAIPYWTRVDEHAAQLQYVVGKILRRDIQTCRKCLSLKPTVVIPVAQRMRMCSNKASYKSFHTVFEHVQGPKSSRVSSYFEEKIKEKVSAYRGNSSREQQAISSEAMKDIKLEVYKDICKNLVLPNILSRYMADSMPSAEILFQFRKNFTSQVAANSVLQHILAVVERIPTRFMFCSVTGQVLTQDFRFQYNQGLLEKCAVPFRMTRNMVEFIGPFLLEGLFVPSFANVSAAMNAKKEILEPVLHLLLRDDIISWYTSKSFQRNDQKMQELEQQLSERLKSNVRYVQERLRECSPKEVNDASIKSDCASPKQIDDHVRQLLDAATCPANLSGMSSSFQAWL